MPWEGYEQGVIRCRNCGFDSSDDTARRGKIQKCDQCSQIVYIPSGLYSKHNPGVIHKPQRKKMPRPFFVMNDIMGAALTKLYRSKIKWFLLIFIVIGAIGLLTGLFFIKNNPTKVADVEPPVRTYYNTIVPIRGDITQALDNFKNEAGGIAIQKDFTYWRTPANRDRFIRACDRTLKTIQSSITVIAVMQEQLKIPPEAQNYQLKLMNSLVDRQRFYARLKDGIDKNDQKLWDAAFAEKNAMADSTSDEISALENLRDLALNRPTTPNAKK